MDRHLLDALAGVELMEGARSLLDVGSGAGLPAIPLLCVRPDLRATLLEPRHKRWAFLKLVIRELELDGTVLATRYQELAPSDGPWDRITTRAIGGHDELLRALGPRLTPDGAVVLWVTADEVERLESTSGWRVVGFALPRSHRGRLAYLQPCST
jgi:16S rRNA (guanine527-N7)-methyltransferase